MGFTLYRTDEEIKKLWNDFSDEIYPLCCSYMQDTNTADKALVKVFIEMMKYELAFDNSTAAENWLFSASEAVCHDMLHNWWDSSGEYVSEDSESIEITDEFKEIIKLPYKYKLVFFLYCYKNLSAARITEITNIPQHTVRNRLHKTKQYLSEAYFDKYKEGYASLKLTAAKSFQLLELVILKAHDEEFYSNIIPEEEQNDNNYENPLYMPVDFDDMANSIALIKANLPKLLPGAVCIIAVIVISIWYFIKNPM